MSRPTDEAFAWSLYADPSPLLAQRTRLVYDAELQRHVFHGVEHDSLAHALGLRNGDILESVGDRVIDDLDSALEAYVQLGQESALHVRIEREAKWLDFTYTFVP